MEKHLESLTRREDYKLSEKDRAAVEKTVAELKKQGYQFEYQETQNEILITHSVDGKQRTTHFTMVDDFAGLYDLLIKATIVHPNEQLPSPASVKNQTAGLAHAGSFKDHLRSFLEKLSDATNS